MSNRNTRIDVEVNTQNARNQLRELANETSRINNQVNSTSTSTASSGNSRTQDVNQTINLLRQQSAERERQIREQFNSLRKANISEYEEFAQKHKAGKISDDDFNEYRRGFSENQIDSFGDERQELSENQNRTNELIQELIDRQDENTRAEIVASQRDNSEHSGGEGILKKLFGKRSELMESRLNATSESELKDINKQLDKVNKDIIKRSGGGNRIADTVTEGGNLASSVMSGGGGQAALGMLSKAGPWGMAAAAVIGAAFGGIMLGNARDKTISNLTSYRALGDRDVVNQSIKDTDYTRYGMEDAEEFINKRKELLLASGRYQGGSVENTMDAVRLERGYGIENVAGLSSLERQDKYAKSTSDNILEMLNVLSAIRDGSISVDDLTLANEKAGLMNRLQSGQVSRQEQFDNRQILGLMTAFEKLGGEGKDQRAGDFIEGTLGAMREGGNQNMMLLKHQFAMDAHPELANDPAALSRIIEEGNDPAYITSSLKGLNRMFGGNKQAKYFGFKEFFQGSGLTASMREKLMELSNNPDALQNIMGVGLGNTGAFNQSNADSYAYDKTQGTEEAWGVVKKEISNIGDWFKEFFRDPVDVNIKNADKNTKSSSTIDNNKVHK